MNGTTPIYRVATITPDLAREWLKKNTHNRPLAPKRVNTLTEAMKRGEWRENGDAIRFSRDDVLLDGQTRLAAVVKSGVTVRSLVAEGLDPETQITVDTGQPRGFSQELQLRGYKDPHNIGALARWVYRWETGQIRSMNRPPTFPQLLHIVEQRFADLEESNSVARSVRSQLPVRRAIIGLAHWVFSDLAPEDAPAFFARLRDGSELSDGNPILALRSTILRDATSNAGRMNNLMVLALTIKAWNAYRTGEEVLLLRWRAGGAAPEEFPEPK